MAFEAFGALNSPTLIRERPPLCREIPYKLVTAPHAGRSALWPSSGEPPA